MYISLKSRLHWRQNVAGRQYCRPATFCARRHFFANVDET